MAKTSKSSRTAPAGRQLAPRRDATPAEVAAALLSLHAAQDRQALAEAISSLTAAFDEESAVCAFLDDNSGLLVPFLGEGSASAGVAATKLSLAQPGPASRVLESGDTLVLDSLRELMGEQAPDLPARRILLARLQWQDERLGVVLFFDQGSTSLELCPRLADHIALALVRLRTLDHRLRFGGIDPSRWLFDREWLHLRLEEEVERAQRYQHSLTLLLFVFENLDEVAKSAGRHQTEVFLRKAAAVIRNQIRGPDVLAGYGTASIAVLMTETSKAAAAEVQLRIASRLFRMRFAVDGPQPLLFLGAASCPDDSDSAAGLLKAAESSLSAYEDAGRLQQSA
ncbi:MAG: diguanylate cyclase [Dehalococcoidia bacterium]|jgi:diguanylate cyclase (GGDEF)-like protein